MVLESGLIVIGCALRAVGSTQRTAESRERAAERTVSGRAGDVHPTLTHEIVGAAIEQNHDDAGIIWPAPLAPFDVVLVPINMHRSDEVKAAAEALYSELTEKGLEVLLDDRKARPGVMFADAELIGIPHRLVISDRGLAAGELEYRHRNDAESRNLKREEALKLLE